MKEILNSDSQNLLSPEQINLIELNLELSVEERIRQLQSAVNFIEEMRASLANELETIRQKVEDK